MGQGIGLNGEIVLLGGMGALFMLGAGVMVSIECYKESEGKERWEKRCLFSFA